MRSEKKGEATMAQTNVTVRINLVQSVCIHSMIYGVTGAFIAHVVAKEQPKNTRARRNIKAIRDVSFAVAVCGVLGLSVTSIMVNTSDTRQNMASL
jgi:H+/Cl- antiporter ClcA